MKSTARTSVVLGVTIVSAVVSVGATAADSTTADREDYATPALVQRGHGPGGPQAQAVLGFEYGSAELIQLGHGPGGPPAAPLGE